MIKNARMRQDPQPGKSGSSGQPMEIAADQLDFQLADGNQIQAGDTVGKAWITILPASGGAKPAANAKNNQTTGGNSTTVATAGKFHAIFDDRQPHPEPAWLARLAYRLFDPGRA